MFTVARPYRVSLSRVFDVSLPFVNSRQIRYNRRRTNVIQPYTGQLIVHAMSHRAFTSRNVSQRRFVERTRNVASYLTVRNYSWLLRYSIRR